MTFQNVLDTFFLRDDQDAFARSQGWQDAEQMCHYEDMTMQQEVPTMTDREMEAFVERESAIAAEAEGKVEYLAPPPSEILVLMKQDSREVYTDSEDCPDDGDLSEWASAAFGDLAGVY